MLRVIANNSRRVIGPSFRHTTAACQEAKPLIAKSDVREFLEQNDAQLSKDMVLISTIHKNANHELSKQRDHDPRHIPDLGKTISNAYHDITYRRGGENYDTMAVELNPYTS